MYKALVFDWHGVLDRRTFKGMLEIMAHEIFCNVHIDNKGNLVGYNDILEQIKKDFQEDGYRYASGSLTPEQFWNKMAEICPGNAMEVAQLYIRGMDLDRILINKIPELSQLYKFAILSDCPEDKLSNIRKEVNLDWFSALSFSCETGLLKSDKKSFRDISEKLRIEPKNCLFIDDNLNNVNTAERAEFNTHHFTDAYSFLRRLVKDGFDQIKRYRPYLN